MKSCQEVLKQVLTERTTKNPAYSLRSFARDLGLSAASMSSILNGDRGLSPQMAEKISVKLPLNPTERERFVNLAMAQFARSSQVRASAKKYLRSKQGLLALKKLKVSEILLRNWYHMALLEAISDESFDPTVDNLMERLKLSRHQVELGLEELTSIQAVVLDAQGRYQDNLGNLEVEDTADSLPLRGFHSQVLDRAKIALTEQSSQELYSQSMIFSVSEDLVPEIREAVRAFIRQVSEIVSKSEGKEQIRCLTVQHFKLDR